MSPLERVPSGWYGFEMIQISGSSSGSQISKWLACWQSLRQRPEAGFLNLADDSAAWSEIARRASALGAGLRPVRHVVVIGTGGSSLGTQVITNAIPSLSGVSLDYLDSPDPFLWERMRGRLTSESHFLLVSKSGSTLETLVWIERLAAAGLVNAKNSTLIASPGQGCLQAWAERERVPTLWIPDLVGGRYSVLSAVGMLPAALMGLSLEGFREGATWAVAKPELAARLSEVAWTSWQRGEWITQLWNFSASLHSFGDWWQQLWAESLAKKIDREGQVAPRASSPMACAGPRDQHSILQQLIEGPRDKFVYVTRVAASEADSDFFTPALVAGTQISGHKISLGQILGVEAQAFERSLDDTGIQHLTIQLAEVSEASLGALFMIWQMAVALLGERMGIDPFNQPGVELGKKHATQMLSVDSH